MACQCADVDLVEHILDSLRLGISGLCYWPQADDQPQHGHATICLLQAVRGHQPLRLWPHVGCTCQAFNVKRYHFRLPSFKKRLRTLFGLKRYHSNFISVTASPTVKVGTTVFCEVNFELSTVIREFDCITHY